jgi:hypothetical protein
MSLSAIVENAKYDEKGFSEIEDEVKKALLQI